MKERRGEALKMRLKGSSYNEINAKLGIPKATLSGWLKDVVLSDAARSRLEMRMRQGTTNGLIKRNKYQTIQAQKRAKDIQDAARREIGIISERELCLMGAALYWAEGYRRPKTRDGKKRIFHSIRFVNSDPEMMKAFALFLRRILLIPEEDMRVTMRLYAHISEDQAMLHWMKATGLSRVNFRKTSYLVTGASKGVRPYTRLPWGTAELEVSNTAKFHRLLGLIEGVKDGL